MAVTRLIRAQPLSALASVPAGSIGLRVTGLAFSSECGLYRAGIKFSLLGSDKFQQAFGDSSMVYNVILYKDVMSIF